MAGSETFKRLEEERRDSRSLFQVDHLLLKKVQLGGRLEEWGRFNERLMNSGRWSLFQVHGPGVTSIEEEIEEEEKVKSIVEILAEEGHIRVPRFLGVLRQTEFKSERERKILLPHLLFTE